MMNRGPIFLAGADRSGTTLTYAVLASHPSIAMPRLGTNMWTFFYGQHGDLSRPENFERCLAALMRYKNVLAMEPDSARIRHEFRQGPPTYARLFALFLCHYAERVHKPRWGDRISYVERYADEIFAAHPDAVMIHLIRDPRDRYASSIKRWPEQKGQVGGATARWLYSVGLAKRNLAKHPERYRILRYETLVSQPEATIRGLCAFLGEEYDPAMLTMSGSEGFLRKGGNSSFEQFEPGKFTTAAVGRYRKTISAREVAFIQALAGREMRAFDYEPERIELTGRDLLSFCLVLAPNNLGRMVFWRALEAAQHNLPSRVGRTPFARRLVVDGNS
ncbi:MAG: sulfotransferase [Chloroflexi bacterium]|nr:sulfotransferase [Chloroflexota bacterium]